MNVPLLDLQRQYEPIKDQVKKAMLDLFDSKQFIMGPHVTDLEMVVQDYTETKRAVGVSSGTDALILALMALNIGNGDEVITSPFTFFATGGSIHRVGAKPIYVDIDPKTYNIDPAKIEAAITPNTKAIMPVHIFGQMADMDAIMAIAKKHNLYVIEDAAQALGSEFNGRPAGSIGDIGCFSFFPSKNLGACGDAGMVTTNDLKLGERIALLRNHGAKERYYHDEVGGNFRIDAIQAAVLNIKLPLLESQHEARIKNAEFYNKSLKGVQLPFVDSRCRTIYNQYTIRIENRDEFQKKLNDKGIGNAIYYPLPLHLQKCFEYLGLKQGDLPNAEKAANEVISLPVFGELTQEEKTYIVETINKFSN